MARRHDQNHGSPSRNRPLAKEPTASVDERHRCAINQMGRSVLISIESALGVMGQLYDLAASKTYSKTPYSPLWHIRVFCAILWSQTADGIRGVGILNPD